MGSTCNLFRDANAWIIEKSGHLRNDGRLVHRVRVGEYEDWDTVGGAIRCWVFDDHYQNLCEGKYTFSIHPYATTLIEIKDEKRQDIYPEYINCDYVY